MESRPLRISKPISRLEPARLALSVPRIVSLENSSVRPQISKICERAREKTRVYRGRRGEVAPSAVALWGVPLRFVRTTDFDEKWLGTTVSSGSPRPCHGRHLTPLGRAVIFKL